MLGINHSVVCSDKLGFYFSRSHDGWMESKKKGIQERQKQSDVLRARGLQIDSARS